MFTLLHRVCQALQARPGGSFKVTGIWRALLPRACTLLAFLLTLLPGQADTLVDDYEDPASFARWTFYNGAEFPGATGSLVRATGRLGAGARLGYNFTGGGAYVSANLTFPTPLTGAAMAFQVKSPASVRVRLRVGDSTGQTLQYNLSRPLWQMDPAAWYRHVVPLDSPDGWWGGTNDGHVHFPIRNLSILAGDALEPARVGAIDFDGVALLDAVAVTLDPRRQPVVAAPPDRGSLPSRLGVNIHFTSDDRALDAARSAGIQWVRMDLTPSIAWSPATNAPALVDGRWTVRLSSYEDAQRFFRLDTP